MNNKLPKILISLLLFALFAHAKASSVFAAPIVQFAPTSKTININDTFNVVISINTENNAVMGSDVTVLYAGSDLEVTAKTNGGFFPEFTSANNPTGRLELHAYTSAQFDSRTGSGTYANVTFKAKKGSGSSSITFACTSGGTDTNIVTTGGQNIISCSSLNQIGVTYTGGDTINTPTPTSDGSSLTPTPTTAPSGGNTTPVCASLTSDITTAIGSPVPVQFTCNGVDTNGYINAVEFVFGDRTSQVIEKNIGSPGSLSTTHTYTTIGTLGTSCRVRDNDNVWSSVSDVCKKIITIKPKPSATPKITGSPTLSPTPEDVTIISETPPPVTPTAEATPTPMPDQTASSSSSTWWLLGGGVIAVLFGLLLLRRRDPPANPPIPPMNPPTDMNATMRPQM